MSKLLDAALDYAKQGFYVIPLPAGQKKPPPSGWKQSATKDSEKIKEIWNKTPDANIGIVCGYESGLYVIDVDVKDNAGGFDSLAEIEKQIGPINAPEVITPSGGKHYYFRMPKEPLGNKVNVLPGIDARSNGGYVVAPPSVIEEGEYRWK
jgi:hypothetical protein